ncbi:MAG TPA: hypothetical protein VFV87_11175 [Pirellulaceae bacterium]|nr:hypothetical protein [Pirellulaceae bacterium]
MGQVRMGPPEELVLHLRDQAAVSTFVETGTFQGRTTRWAARHFQRVHTIEREPALHEAAKLRLEPYQHVTCHLGHSREVLAGLAPSLTTPCLFWLDAHWSGGVTAGNDDECPLLEEIAEIDRHNQQHLLLIDDARLFLAPPPPPHRPESWPSIDAVCRALLARGEAYVCVHDDVILRVPRRWQHAVVEFFRRNTRGTPSPANPARNKGLLSWFGSRAA